MDRGPFIRLLTALGPAATRQAAIDRLASELGVAAAFLFVTHPDVPGKLITAPGIERRLPSGRGWRDLLARATTPGLHDGVVAYPTSAEDAPAIAYALGAAVVVVVGTHERDPELHAALETLGPMLTATLLSEQQIVLMRSQVAVAHEAATRASALAVAVDVARKQAVHATLVKDEFLAMLGHELRNPLAPMVTGLQMLRLSGGHSRVVEVLERQVAHMSRLVDDLLDVSRITRGKVELRREIVELATVITGALEMARPMLEQQQSDLVVDVPATGLTVNGDPARLSQVISNLVTNAAKYSRRGARIAIRGALVDEHVTISVIDAGIGIERDYLDRVFEQFIQVPQGSDRAAGGLGLGLAIVKSLVRLHGGRVSVQSDGTGMGSTFTVELPFSPGEPTRTTVAPVPRRALHRRVSVLVVDDNEDAAELLGDVLATYGYDPRVAHDGPQALTMLETFTPDVALLDIGLPVMDGYDLARAIHDRLPSAKLVALTGYGLASDRERARAAGFAAHLVKPVSADKVSETLDQLLLR